MEEFFNEHNISNLLYTYFILDVPRDVIKIYSINKLFKKCIDDNHKYFILLFYTPLTNQELKDSVRNYIEEDNTLNLPHISTWNTFLITKMDELFANYRLVANYSKFNENISNWNVSNVINMTSMFYRAYSFNQKLNWNVSNVIYMDRMFYYASKFNQQLYWDVSNVKNMNFMFAYAIKFKRQLNWNISNNTKRVNMFQ